MKIQTQNYNAITVVELKGELTADFVEMFCDTCSNIIAGSKTSNANRTNTPGIVLDMNKVGFIDSQGLEKLLWLHDFAADAGCELKLAGLDENCAKILEITGLDAGFDCYLELAQAVKSFA